MGEAPHHMAVRIYEGELSISTIVTQTGKKYYLGNNLSKQEIKKIAEKVLSNTVVQKYEIDGN